MGCGLERYKYSYADSSFSTVRVVGSARIANYTNIYQILMFNPLTPDLTNLTDKELTDKLEELWRRATSMRNYYAVHNQLQSLIGSYTAELDKRRQKPLDQ